MKADARAILFVGLTAVVLGLPMLLLGPLVDGHDTIEHINFTRHFTEQFWSGDLYPRWLVDMNHGLGSPTYFVFPPLPAYLCALLEPVGRALRFNSFNVATFLALLASGICAFLLLRKTVGPTEAAVGAALYMAMPYHLVIDFYRRCAIPESWALAWMPLILYFLPGVVAARRRAVVGFAVSYALMVFSHLISVAMFSPIPLFLVVIVSPAGARIRSMVRVAAAELLGFGISAAYLLPAFANAKYISTARLALFWAGSTGANEVVGFGRGMFSLNGGDEWKAFHHLIAWADVSTMALAAVSALALGRDMPGTSRRLSVFWSAICCFSMFMMSRLSSAVWRYTPGLTRAIQWPWRFSAILCIGVLSLLAVLFSRRPWHSLVRDNRVRVALSIIAVFWLFGYGYVWWRYKTDTPSQKRWLPVNDHDGWFRGWSPMGMDPQATLLASAGPRIRFREGDGTADIIIWRPRQIEFRTNSLTGGWVMVNQFYYPTWTASIRGGATPIEVRTALPEGLLEVQVPPGIQNIRVEIPLSRTEHLGRWISLLCAFLCMLLGFSRARGLRSTEDGWLFNSFRPPDSQPKGERSFCTPLSG